MRSGEYASPKLTWKKRQPLPVSLRVAEEEVARLADRADNGRRSSKKLLRAAVARLLGK